MKHSPLFAELIALRNPSVRNGFSHAAQRRDKKITPRVNSEPRKKKNAQRLTNNKTYTNMITQLIS